jgi:hypothetical protein
MARLNARSAAFGALCLTLAAMPVHPQDPARMQRSLDNLEYRVGQLESELGKLRKGQAPGQARPPGRALPDSAVPRLSARLDTLAARLKEIEAEQGRGKATSVAADTAAAAPPAPAAAPIIAGNVDIASLREEIRALTALLREVKVPAGREPSAAPAVIPRPVVGGTPSRPISQAVSGSHPAKLDLKADIQIQGERMIATGSNRDNLDDFWGRLNFGAEYQGNGFQSKANIRIFPEGFGFEPLTGATFDTTGQGAVKVQSQPTSRVVVNHAWVKSVRGSVAAKVGRFETQESHSATYGNYIDLGPGGRFLARPAAHNALEGSWGASASTSSVLLGAGDRKLNRGFLRAYQKYRFPTGVVASAGYRVNLFDRLKFADEELLQRFDASLAWSRPGGWKTFAEAAVLQAKGRGDDTPILLGIQPPMGKTVDLLSLEMEWMPGRKAAGKDKEVLLNIHLRKSLGRLTLDSGLFSDAADPDANAFGFGLRMTAALK